MPQQQASMHPQLLLLFANQLLIITLKYQDRNFCQKIQIMVAFLRTTVIMEVCPKELQMIMEVFQPTEKTTQIMEDFPPTERMIMVVFHQITMIMEDCHNQVRIMEIWHRTVRESREECHRHKTM